MRDPPRGPQTIFASEECCSHCCRPLGRGNQHGKGNVHGQGIYCFTCFRYHVKDQVWYSLKTCRHCVTAGVIDGWLLCG